MGLTIEGLARRIIVILRGNVVLCERDEHQYLPSKARSLAFMESVSQATYDRTMAWYAQEQIRGRGRPRIHLPDYDAAFAAIAYGSAEPTLDDLRDAQRAAMERIPLGTRHTETLPEGAHAMRLCDVGRMFVDDAPYLEWRARLWEQFEPTAQECTSLGELSIFGAFVRYSYFEPPASIESVLFVDPVRYALISPALALLIRNARIQVQPAWKKDEMAGSFARISNFDGPVKGHQAGYVIIREVTQ